MVASWSRDVHIQFQQVLIVQPRAQVYAVEEVVVGVQQKGGVCEQIQAVETQCCNLILLYTLAVLHTILHWTQNQDQIFAYTCYASYK